MNCDNEHENDNFQIPHFDVNEYNIWMAELLWMK